MTLVKPEFFTFDQNNQLVRTTEEQFLVKYNDFGKSTIDFHPWDLIARSCDSKTFRALLCANKELHAYLAAKKDDFAHIFKLPEITVTNNTQFLSNALMKLNANQFLLLSGIRYILEEAYKTREYTPSFSRQQLSSYRYDLPLVELPKQTFLGTIHFSLAHLLTKATHLERFPLKITDDILSQDFPDEYRQLASENLPRVTDLLLSSWQQSAYHPDTINQMNLFDQERDAYIKEHYLDLITQNPNAEKSKNALLSILEKCRKLETLCILGDSFFSHDLEGLEPNSLPLLRTLGIKSNLITAQTLKTILEAAPNLEELDLSLSQIYVDDLFLNLDAGSLRKLKKVILPEGGRRTEAALKSLHGAMTQDHVAAVRRAAPLLEEMRTEEDFIYEDYKVFFPSPINGDDYTLVMPAPTNGQ